MNAAYGFLHAGGMRFLAENVTAMDSNISAGGLMGRAVHPPLEARYALSRAALPCSTDHCPTNISAALGFNGPHAHAPGGLWTQVEALQRYQLSNGATIGADNSDVYALLAAGMLPLEPWVEHCVNSSSVGWNTTYTPGAGGAGPKCTLREVPCPTVFRAHPEFFVCSGSSPSAAGQRGTPPAAASGGGAEAAAAAAAVWPCTFDLMYQRQPYGYNPRERFSTGVAHMCWTGSPVRACQ
eukprot:COSAG01_NODE_1660_length_9588_cov_458.469175_8_plen_239_part_00